MEPELNSSTPENIIPEISTELYKDKGPHCERCPDDVVSVHDFAYNSHSFHNEKHKSVASHYLPDKYNRKDVYELVMALIPLTVLLKFTGKLTASATGRIIQVELSSANEAERTIHIVTTWHFGKYFSDKSAHLSCVLDYDDEQSRGECLQITGIEFQDDKSDICVLLCKTLHMQIAKKLKKRLKTFKKLFCSLYDRMKRTKKEFKSCVTSQWTLSDLVIIVSHPNGGPKKISVGRWIVRDPGRCDSSTTVGHVTQELCYSYTAWTCKACSGAPLLVFGAPSCNVVLIHRGKIAANGTNVSTPGFRIKKRRHKEYLCKFWSGI
ncbi:hypothetical protein Btru_023791 [Bulinus truncatus]|nr:hypothetical protein Btru_023791 [Bulinus truncatus]